MAQIFISYAREDRDSAERLAKSLAAHGWSVWWDRQAAARQRFDEGISQRLKEASCVIALWSAHGIASRWVAEEADQARERGALVQAMLEPVQPPLGFRCIHAADLIGWSGDLDHPGFAHLAQDVALLLAGKPLSGVKTDGACRPEPMRAPTTSSGSTRKLRLIKLSLPALALLGAITFVIGSRGHPADGSGEPDPKPLSMLEGRWEGRVLYDGDVVRDESFSFRTIGQTLSGSAEFLGMPRGIVDAEFDGRTLRFATTREEGRGAQTRNVAHKYVGEIKGESRIDMVLTIADDTPNQHAPIAFTLRRTGPQP